MTPNSGKITYVVETRFPYRIYLCRKSNNGLLLMENTPNSTFGERAFSVATPKLWNKLPFAIRNIDNINSFKKN